MIEPWFCRRFWNAANLVQQFVAAGVCGPAYEDMLGAASRVLRGGRLDFSGLRCGVIVVLVIGEQARVLMNMLVKARAGVKDQRGVASCRRELRMRDFLWGHCGITVGFVVLNEKVRIAAACIGRVLRAASYRDRYTRRERVPLGPERPACIGHWHCMHTPPTE